jgi:tricorn protease
MKLYPFLLLAVSALPAGAAEALWLRDVQISPDGSEIAFCYKGDIYTVASSGGTAKRLTTLSSYEEKPVWSPDGKKIAFASDRNGNADIFIMDANGGPATRLSFNSASEYPEGFTPDGKEVLFSAAIQNPPASAVFPSGRMTELYAVSTDGKSLRQVLGTPAQMTSFTPSGKMLYQDVKGIEDEWRKHHTSSVTRDIWLYDPASGQHTNLTNYRPGEDRNPVASPDGSTVYLLSERDGGSFNVWAFPIDNPSQATQITRFDTHPVRFLSGAGNGTLAFTYDGAIYTLPAGSKNPVRLTVDVVEDDLVQDDEIGIDGGGQMPSPDGKSVAFISRGDIFVTSVEYPTTMQVTRTPAAEDHISWGDDNRTLYYTSERSGHKNIYRATMDRDEDPNFPNAMSVKEEPMFDVPAPAKLTDAVTEYSHPVISPDGKQMAFVKDRNQIWVMDLASRNVRQLTDGSNYPGQDDGVRMVWSPDSHWLAIELIPEMRDPYSDIALLNVDTGELTNLTQSGYFCNNPRFVLDGNALIFFTERYGLRAQASWGSQEDVMIVFLNREARDRFMLSEEDYALLQDTEKEAKRNAEPAKEEKGKKGKKGKKNDKEETKADDDRIVVELDDIESRMMRLTPYSSSLSDAIITADGETLYYLSAFDNGFDLWKMPLRDGDPELVSKLGSRSGVGIESDKDGSNLFLTGARLQKLDPNSGKITPVKISARHKIDAAAEREAMFDNMVVEEAARFYDKGMHGVDWPAMTEAYRKFLPHLNNNADFAELLAELLGELNVSHTGGRFYGNMGTAYDRTANLGLLYDPAYTGEGLKVAEVIVNGPFDKSTSKIGEGSVITAINGTEIKTPLDADRALNSLIGKKTLVAFTTADGSKVEEITLPLSAAKVNRLLYDRWVKQREEDVRRWSDGRLGYVHIPSMNDASFRPMYDALLGKYNNCEGVVIDIRWNGGGRMHEDIEQLFTGEKYLTQVIRGKEVCDMPSRRWNKPSVMLVAEPCYSNAHGTPWVYQHQGIGKVVGMPIPGTMTSVNWVDMQDPDLVFGIPVIGYRTAEGNYLENTQLEPDVKVANDPATIVRGEDRQLRTAVETLLKELGK